MPKLSPKQQKNREKKQEIARKLFIDGYPLRDIADITGMSHEWVRQTLAITVDNKKGEIIRNK